MGPHGTFHWNELLTDNPDKAAKFYETVCDWKFEAFPMEGGAEYSVAMAGETPAGGIMNKTQTGMPDMPTHWTAYINVKDVDAAVAKVEGAGGTVMSPCFDVPGVGRIAVIQDPTGGVIGIMTPAPEENAG